MVTVLLVLAVGLGLGWRAVQRHDALLSNAEDLGFTDQILWNFLHGQFFRFTTYQNAEFATDINLAAVRRVDSLLAFHVEPILIPLAPLYWLVPDVRAILWLQGICLALGAIPAYRLATRRLGSPLAGLAFAAVYLLSPLGQWAAVADFHSVALAAPLLLLAIDALDEGRSWLFLLAGLLAASTKEEIGLLTAGLGVVGLLWRWRSPTPSPSIAAILLGAGWSALCVTVIIPFYSGGAISPFTARYADLGGSPGAMLRTLVEQPSAYLSVLGRPEVAGYLWTLLLGGAWLGLLAPELLVVAAPVLLLNVLSNSPWMAAGRAHYSASVLPIVVAAAIVGLGRLALLAPAERRRYVLAVLSVAVVLGAAYAYRQNGVGPLVADLTAPTVLPRHLRAEQIAASIPAQATVSASTALYPHLSQRAGAFMFPTVNHAEYVFVDIAGASYPTAPGGIHKRLQELLTGREYRLLLAEDGFLLLHRGPVTTSQQLPDDFLSFARVGEDLATGPGRRASALPEIQPVASFHDGAVEMVSARLVPSSEVGPRGPLGTLETVWRVRRPVPERPRPEITVRFRDGTDQTFANATVLWWYPPERWQPDELVRIDVPGLPVREVVDWQAAAPLDPPP